MGRVELSGVRSSKIWSILTTFAERTRVILSKPGPVMKAHIRSAHIALSFFLGFGVLLGAFAQPSETLVMVHIAQMQL